MFDIYGCHFTYGDFDSSKYDLIFANINTSRNLKLQSDQNINTIRLSKNNKHLLTSYLYEDAPMTFDAEIVTLNENPIGESYLNEVERALFRHHSYLKLYPFEGYYDSDKEVYVNCLMSNPVRIETEAGVVGYQFKLTTDSAMAWEDTTVYEFSFSDSTAGTKTFVVEVDSDMDDYIYPVVEFQMGSSGGNVTLFNNTDDSTRFTSFTSVPAYTTFTMKGDISHITNGVYQYFSDRNFIRLLNGTNSFFFTGNVTSVTVSFNNRKYL